jgi:hypothetical protein
MKDRVGVLTLGLVFLTGGFQLASAQKVSAPAVDSLQLRGIAQAQFNTTSAEDEPESEWLIRRARLGARAYVGGWIQGFVEGDFGKGGARLTDGWVNLRFDKRFQLKLGQFKVPIDALELTSSRQLPVVERDPIPRGAVGFSPNGLLDDLGYNGRDIGAGWTGAWPSVTVEAGFFNGSGDNSSEDDDGKQVAARVTGKLQGTWRLAVGWTGIRVSDPPADDDAAWYNAVEIAATHGTYGEPGWRGLGQIIFGDDYDPDVFGDDDASFVALQGVAGYHVPLYNTAYLIGMEPVVRLGWARVNDGSIVIDDELVPVGDDPETLVATGGVNLFWQDNVVTQFQVDVADPNIGDSDTEVAFRFQAGFAF